MARKRAPAADGGLVQEVCEHPANDAPRLVYADWLEEHGQAERAELIRVQIELARLDVDDARRDDLEWRAWELLVTRDAAWREALPTWARQEPHEWRRGFVEHVSMTATQFLRKGADLARATPLRSVRLRALGHAMPQVAASPLLGQVEALDLRDNALVAGDLQTLLASPHLGRLRELGLWRCNLHDQDLEDLGRWTRLPGLEGLKLGLNPLTSRGLRALLGSGRLAGLRRLELAVLQAEVELGHVAASAPLPRLTRLSLRQCELGRAGVQAIAWSDQLAGLRSLSLEGNSPGASGFAALAPSPLLGQLTDLDLTATAPDASGLRSLAASSRLGALRRLVLSHNDLAGRLAALVPARLPSPRSLAISGANLGPDDARALAAAPWLAGLTTLDLHRNRLGPEGVAALVSSPHLTSLRTLDLSENQLGEDGLRALAASLCLAGVRRLLLRENGLGGQTAAILASSPHLGQLRHLSLATNALGSTTDWQRFRQTLARLPRLLVVDVNFAFEFTPARSVQEVGERVLYWR
jgi:uncharacterized protein (TIGR02996 family)